MRGDTCNSCHRFLLVIIIVKRSRLVRLEKPKLLMIWLVNIIVSFYVQTSLFILLCPSKGGLKVLALNK